MSQKVFISYSWTTPEHEEWVLSLAQRLRPDGVDIVLDKWDLREGQDKYIFMESTVNSPEINKVLLILDRMYTERADSRSGGVGTETQIISPNIYENAKQEMFIPIIRERNIEGKAFIPTFLRGKIYIDLSKDEEFEENYEKLLRNIYQRPSYSKPKLGKAPSYLFEESTVNFNTTYIIRDFEKQLIHKPERAPLIIKDFLNNFKDNLKEFCIIFKSQDPVEIGKQICENINQYTPLRDDLINFFLILTQENVLFDIDILIQFLEELPQFFSPLDDRSNWNRYEFDNFRFIVHEIFLYLVAIGLKNKNYKFVEELLYSSYFSKDKFNHDNETKRFDFFHGHTSIINAYYNATHSNNFLSPMADFIIKRIPRLLSKKELVQADILCYHIAELNNCRWFPITYVYDTSGKYELYYRMQSKRHFEKVKILFGVETADELKKKLKNIEEKKNEDRFRFSYPGSFKSVPFIFEAIDTEKLATIR